MIARIWHGVTRVEHYDAYWCFLQERAIPDYRGTSGNLGVRLFRRREGDRAHFLCLSYWPSLEAIRAWTGLLERRGGVFHRLHPSRRVEVPPGLGRKSDRHGYKERRRD